MVISIYIYFKFDLRSRIIINSKDRTSLHKPYYFIDKMSNKLVVLDYLCVKIKYMGFYIIDMGKTLIHVTIRLLLFLHICLYCIRVKKFFTNLYQIKKNKKNVFLMLNKSYKLDLVVDDCASLYNLYDFFR